MRRGRRRVRVRHDPSSDDLVSTQISTRRTEGENVLAEGPSRARGVSTALAAHRERLPGPELGDDAHAVAVAVILVVRVRSLKRVRRRGRLACAREVIVAVGVSLLGRSELTRAGGPRGPRPDGREGGEAGRKMWSGSSPEALEARILTCRSRLAERARARRRTWVNVGRRLQQGPAQREHLRCDRRGLRLWLTSHRRCSRRCWCARAGCRPSCRRSSARGRTATGRGHRRPWASTPTASSGGASSTAARRSVAAR